MQIEKIITRFGDDFGVMIKDGEETYPVMMQGLHSPMVFDTLLASGWTFNGLPYDFRYDGVPMRERVPMVDFDELGLDNDTVQEMMDSSAMTYDETDLKSKMVREETPELEWETGAYMLHTREEFLKYLDTLERESISVVAPSLYMPLNFLVSPRALFSPQEYFSPANSRYRRIIEDRKQVSLRYHTALVEEFLKLGLKEDFTAMEFLDMYYSWGFCGINARVAEKHYSHEELRLGEKVSSMLSAEDLPRVREYRISYLDTTGQVFRTEETKARAWTTLEHPNTLERRRKELSSIGYDYIMPIYLEKPSQDLTMNMEGNLLSIRYNAQALIYTYNGKMYRSSQYKVVNPINKLDTISYELWNMRGSKSKKAVYETFMVKMLAMHLIEVTRKNVNVSSYNALMASGCSVLSGLNYVFSKYRLIQETLEKINQKNNSASKVTTQDVDAIRLAVDNYLQGNLASDHRYHEDVEALVSDFINGSLNIDNTSDGYQMDNTVELKVYEDFIKIAHKYLGLSTSELYEKISKVKADDDYLDLEGNELRIRIEIVKRDNTYKGYKADLNAYRMRFADEAKQWVFIRNTYRELGGRDAKKHVAVDGYLFHRQGNKNKAFEALITKYVREAIENNVPFNEQETSKAAAPVLISRFVFDAALRGKFQLPKHMGGATIELPAEERAMAKGILTFFVENLVPLCNTTISEDLKVFRYYVNANVTPEVVIPHKGIMMFEKPFAPMWVDTSTAQMAGIRGKWASENLLPAENHYGYVNQYSAISLCDHGNRPEDSKWSLTAYHNRMEEWRREFDTRELFRTGKHPYLELFPVLDVEDDVAFIPRDTGEEGPHKFVVGTQRIINRETIFGDFEEIKNMFEPIDLTDTLQLEGQYLKTFQWYSPGMLNSAGSLDVLDLKMDFDNKIKLVLAMNTSHLVFEDNVNKTYSVSDIVNLDPETYAVRKVDDRVYVMSDNRGNLWEARV